MKTLIVGVLLAAAAMAHPRPQEVDLSLINELFGKGGQDGPRQGDAGYSGNTDTNIDALVQVVKEVASEPYKDDFPTDYVETTDYSSNEAENLDKATVEVNTDFSECAAYTETQGYQCVPYYQCRNGTIITDGTGLIDIRNGFGALNAEGSKCPGFLDVCCKDPTFVAPPPPPPRYTARCGRRNINGLQTRIQGFLEGESQFGEWPHMVAVLRNEVIEGEQINLYQCGGSLIAPGVVLTAAHCVDKYRSTPQVFKVRSGEWDTQAEAEPYIHQDRDIVALRVHPDFNAGNLENDVAVLFTNADFELSPHVDTICLPNFNEIFDFNTCFATGWGKDKFGKEGEYQVVLKEIDLPVVPNAQCENSLRSTRLGKLFNLHDSFICAGGEANKDTCKGDGGSPLVCRSKFQEDIYVQAGIVAWGIGCGESNIPGVYASVSQPSSLCFIDYAMSTYFGSINGDFSSFWNYPGAFCRPWLTGVQDKLQAGLAAPLPEAVKQNLNQVYSEFEANVLWNDDPLPEVISEGGYGGNTDGEKDLSQFERSGSSETTTTAPLKPKSAVRFGR